MFSADYELFFGENYLPEREVLIEPTAALLIGFLQEGIPVTLFADVASVWRYREVGVKSDYADLFEEQLKTAIRGGHDVQLHLHPHWLTSDRVGHGWHMDESRFKLSDLGYAKANATDVSPAEGLILRGKQYLENLLQPVNHEYECIAFRAGGYAIQPDDKLLIGALLSAKLKIDSSIVPGMVLDSNVNKIDFRKIPAKLNYRMGPRFGIAREEACGIYEIPIAGYRETFTRRLMKQVLLFGAIRHLFKNRRLRKQKGFARRGRGIQGGGFSKKVISRLRQQNHFRLELSGPYVDVEQMVKMTRRVMDRHLEDGGDLYLSASCHPKNTYATTIQAIREFWRLLSRAYGERIEAITFSEAVRGRER